MQEHHVQVFELSRIRIAKWIRVPSAMQEHRAQVLGLLRLRGAKRPSVDNQWITMLITGGKGCG